MKSWFNNLKKALRKELTHYSISDIITLVIIMSSAYIAVVIYLIVKFFCRLF